MKYITTDKHPELKKGLELDYWAVDDTWRARPSSFYQCSDTQFQYLLAKGYIKEVEEKEFTISDIDDFLSYYFNADINSALLNAVNHSFDTWLKQRNE